MFLIFSSPTKEPVTTFRPLSFLSRWKPNDACDDQRSRTLFNDDIDANAASHSDVTNLDNTQLRAIGGRTMMEDDRDVRDVNASDAEVDYSDVDASYDEADDDGCREYSERMNRKLGIALSSTQMDGDNEDHMVDVSSSKSVANPFSNRRLPRICQFEDHHYYNGTKRRLDAAADHASMPSRKKSRHISREGEVSDNYKSAVHSAKPSVHNVKMSFERQNEEYSERLNRGIGCGGRGRTRGDVNDDARRIVGSGKGAATAKESNSRGNHHSPPSFAHSAPPKTKGRQSNPQKARFDTSNLRMYSEDLSVEDSYYPDSKNGTKMQPYNDTTIVSRQQNKCSTDSVDEWGIADIRAETPLRFSNTGMMHKEEEEDIVACDQRDSPENRQATTPKRTPPATGLADRWESPPSSASPLWSFGVKNHKNFSKTGT